MPCCVDMIFSSWGAFCHPRWHSGVESACQCRRHKRQVFDPWVRNIPWRRKWQPTTVFLSGKSHGHRSLAGYNPWGCKELDTTEHTGIQAIKMVTSLEMKSIHNEGQSWGNQRNRFRETGTTQREGMGREEGGGFRFKLIWKRCFIFKWVVTEKIHISYFISHFPLCVYVHACIQSCLTFCDPMECSLLHSCCCC